VIAGVVGLTTAVVAQILIDPLLPRALELAGVLMVVLPIAILRGLYDTFVVRRHEAEADEFAVDVAGAPALLAALGVLDALGPGDALVHNRWTTHSTWERRTRRIRSDKSL
jgi:Zn-dependent protease with chaperone function